MRMKKRYYWIIGILLLLIFTNPSVKAFKDYLGHPEYVHVQRPINFIIGSVFRVSEGTYVGILDNFIRLK